LGGSAGREMSELMRARCRAFASALGAALRLVVGIRRFSTSKKALLHTCGSFLVSFTLVVLM
jgi:hypothetical protein